MKWKIYGLALSDDASWSAELPHLPVVNFNSVNFPFTLAHKQKDPP